MKIPASSSNYGRMGTVELEKEIDYEISFELNKNAMRPRLISLLIQRCAYGYRNCKPGAKPHNSQLWKFVKVRGRKC